MGKVDGLDASIWLNKALFSSPEISSLFHQSPSVSLTSHIDWYFDLDLAELQANNVRKLFGCGGARIPLETATNILWQKKVSDAIILMENLIDGGD